MATDDELVEKLIRDLSTSDLIKLWENLTSEINSFSVIFDMNFFLKECLSECSSPTTVDDVAECDIKSLAVDVIHDYNLAEYSAVLKNKLAELKE